MLLIFTLFKEAKVEEEKAGKAKAEEEAKKKGGRKAKKQKVTNTLAHGVEMQTYIFRVLKEQAPEYGISKMSINMLNEIIIDLYDQILQESRGIMMFSKKQTLSSKECESAIKLIIPGELGKEAVKAGRNALARFSG